jgi:hypothetical protein
MIRLLSFNRAHHSLGGITNLKYKLLCFLTPNKKNSKRKALAFNRDRCGHLALPLHKSRLISQPAKEKCWGGERKIGFHLRTFENRLGTI